VTAFEFLKDKIVYIISQSIVAALTVSIIWALDPLGGPALSMLIGILYVIGFVIPLVTEYHGKKEFYRNLLRIYDTLDKRNLIGEMTVPPQFKEGMILCDLLRGCNKAMLEEINKYKFLQEEYREYMEIWVHEIKTPIASSRLVAQNNRGPVADSMSEEIDKIEGYVEQVLFYSRSNAVEKDYIIKEVNLQRLCYDVLKRNSKLFIRNNIGAETDNLDVNVFSDAKWIEFILNQLLINAVKYSKKSGTQVKLSTRENENNVVLSVEDNGIGILEEELPRIFDKGFTGTNGRRYGKSTGMGLYICRKLCDKLGLSIEAYSKVGKGTRISIVFPKSSMTGIR
jgi:signal transduction histidine kinase